LFWKVQVPAARPHIFSGIKIGFTYTIIGVIALEFLVQTGGVGKMVAAAYFRFQTDTLYAGIIFIMILSMVFNVAIGELQRRIR